MTRAEVGGEVERLPVVLLTLLLGWNGDSVVGEGIEEQLEDLTSPLHGPDCNFF